MNRIQYMATTALICIPSRLFADPPPVPPATNTVRGTVVCDGTTTNCVNGTISAIGGGATVPLATTSVPGKVQPNGTSIGVNGAGVIGTIFGTITGSVADGGLLAAASATANAALPSSGGPITGSLSIGGSLLVGGLSPALLTGGLLPASELPAATTSVQGAVKPDGSTCTISTGLLVCAGTAANVGVSPTAAAPHVSGDPTTGFYSAGTGLMDVAAGGTQLVEFSKYGLNLTNQNTSILFNGSPFIHLGPTALYKEGNYVGPRAGVTLIGSPNSGNGLYGAGPDSLRFLVNAYAETVAVGAYTGEFQNQGNANSLFGEHVMGFDDGSYNSLFGQDCERNAMGTQMVECFGAQTVEDGANVSDVIAVGSGVLAGSAGYLSFTGTFHQGDTYTVTYSTTNPQVLSGNGFSHSRVVQAGDTPATIAAAIASTSPHINAYVTAYDPLGAIQVDSTFYGSLTAGDTLTLSCTGTCPAYGPVAITGSQTFYAIKPVYTNTNGTLTVVANAINLAPTQAQAIAVPPVPYYLTTSNSGSFQVIDTSNTTTSVAASTAVIPNYIVNYINGSYDLNPLSAENNTQLLESAGYNAFPGVVKIHVPGAGTTDHYVTSTGPGTLSGAGTNTALGWGLTPSISCSGSCTGTVGIGPAFQGSNLVAIGDSVLSQPNLIAPTLDIFEGTTAGLYVSGSPSYIVCLAPSGCQNMTSSSLHEIILGYGADNTDTGGGGNILIGDREYGITTGQNNIILRTQTTNSNDGCITTGVQNIEIGRQACVPSSTGTNQIDIQGVFWATGASAVQSTPVSAHAGINYNAPDEILSIGAPTGGAHIDFKQTTAPTFTCTGTGTVGLGANNADAASSITAGTASTGCTETFAGTYSVAPVCNVTSPNGALGFSWTWNSAGVTITNTSATGDQFNIECL
jgi:hypothetical protein